MTRDRAVGFLSNAGLIFDVDEFDDDYACIAFKFRGTTVKLFTSSDDPDFLCLVCSYTLHEQDVDALAVARILADVQLNLKVVKLAVDIESHWVAASAEQFLPECADFERIFWRSVELVIHAVRRANHEIHLLAHADGPAQRFTRRMESELQLNGENS